MGEPRKLNITPEGRETIRRQQLKAIREYEAERRREEDDEAARARLAYLDDAAEELGEAGWLVVRPQDAEASRAALKALKEWREAEVAFDAARKAWQTVIQSGASCADEYLAYCEAQVRSKDCLIALRKAADDLSAPAGESTEE